MEIIYLNFAGIIAVQRTLRKTENYENENIFIRNIKILYYFDLDLNRIKQYNFWAFGVDEFALCFVTAITLSRLTHNRLF